MPKKNIKETNKQNKVKKRNHKKSGWFFIIALIVFLAVYLSVSFALNAGNTLSTVVVKKGSVEDSIYSEGYIFKDSLVVTSNKNGYIDCLKDDEEKVKKGEAIVAVYTDEVNAGLKSEISEIDEKIASLEKTVKYKSSSDGDYAKTEQSISDKMKKIGALTDSKDIKQISQIKKDVSAMLMKRSNVTDDRNEESELEALRVKKNSLMSSLSEQATVIYASQPGAFTSKVDGAEEVLSLKNIKENKVDHKYFAELKKMKLENMVTGQVNEGSPVGKIVNNYEWNLVMEIPATESDFLTEGDEISVRFTELDENEVSGKILKISSEENDKVIITVKSNKYVKSVYHTSRAQIQLIKRVYRGIKIPQKALRIIDGKKGVYVVRGNLARFIPVDIKYSDENWVITPENEESGGIKLYDEVVLKGKNLFDGKIVK